MAKTQVSDNVKEEVRVLFQELIVDEVNKKIVELKETLKNNNTENTELIMEELSEELVKLNALKKAMNKQSEAIEENIKKFWLGDDEGDYDDDEGYGPHLCERIITKVNRNTNNISVSIDGASQRVEGKIDELKNELKENSAENAEVLMEEISGLVKQECLHEEAKRIVDSIKWFLLEGEEDEDLFGKKLQKLIVAEVNKEVNDKIVDLERVLKANSAENTKEIQAEVLGLVKPSDLSKEVQSINNNLKNLLKQYQQVNTEQVQNLCSEMQCIKAEVENIKKTEEQLRVEQRASQDTVLDKVNDLGDALKIQSDDIAQKTINELLTDRELNVEKNELLVTKIEEVSVKSDEKMLKQQKMINVLLGCNVASIMGIVALMLMHFM